MLGEALQIFHAMWKEPYATFEGQYYQVRGAMNYPKGVQQPHIPIWVGGSGEKVTLKLVAKYGDACNVTAIAPEDYRHKLDVLKGHCDTVGRGYDTIIKSAHVFLTLVPDGQNPEQVTEPFRSRQGWSLEEYRKRNFVGTPAQAIVYLSSLYEAGIEYFVFYFRNDLTRFDTIQLFAEEVMGPMRKT